MGVLDAGSNMSNKARISLGASLPDAPRRSAPTCLLVAVLAICTGIAGAGQARNPNPEPVDVVLVEILSDRPEWHFTNWIGTSHRDLISKTLASSLVAKGLGIRPESCGNCLMA